MSALADVAEETTMVNAGQDVLTAIHGALKDIAVHGARMDERLASMDARIAEHLVDEDRQNTAIEARIGTLEKSVGEIHAAAKVTRTIAAAVATLAGAWAWFGNHFTTKG